MMVLALSSGASWQDQADEFQDTIGSGEQFISIRDYFTLRKSE